jgi:hypothetical protein
MSVPRIREKTKKHLEDLLRSLNEAIAQSALDSQIEYMAQVAHPGRFSQSTTFHTDQCLWGILKSFNNN